MEAKVSKLELIGRTKPLVVEGLPEGFFYYGTQAKDSQEIFLKFSLPYHTYSRIDDNMSDLDDLTKDFVLDAVARERVEELVVRLEAKIAEYRKVFPNDREGIEGDASEVPRGREGHQPE